VVTCLNHSFSGVKIFKNRIEIAVSVMRGQIEVSITGVTT
jgi:hypothetical protein